MRKESTIKVNFILAALFVITMTAMHSHAQDVRDFTVINASGYDIKFVGVNKPGDEIWNENEVKGVLRAGESLPVKFRAADGTNCVWNIKIRWSQDNSTDRINGVDLCKYQTVTITYDDKTNQTTFMPR